MSRPTVIGIDSSTQSCKVEVRDLTTGEVVADASAPHPVTSPPVSEQDPQAWWDALTQSFDAIKATHPDALADAAAVSVGAQQHGLVLLDDDGAPTRPAKLWNDTTSAPQAQRLIDELGADRWAEMCGSVPVAAFTVTKLAWVVDNDPEAIARTSMVMLPHDYLTWRLSGEHATDRGDASGTGWFNPSSDAYLPACLDASGVDGDLWLDKLPRVVGYRERVGMVRPDVAARLGLPDDVIVAPGTGDNMAAAMGLGLVAGDIVISLGTSGTAYALSSTPTHDPSGAVAGFASASGGYLPLVCTLNATKVTDTTAAWLGTDAAGLANLALGAADQPGTVMMVPFFDGERTPNLPDATGSLVALTNATTREQIALAAHDAVLCSLLDGVDALAELGATSTGRIRLIGGGSRSTAYRQRAADLTNSTVIVPTVEQAVATGAAVQAAMVTALEDVDEVAARWGLGGGTEVPPARDARDRRVAYRALVESVTPSS